MSATSATLEAPVRATVTRERVTQTRVIRSEWTKLWSLRSTRWTLLVAILGMAGLGPLIATIQMNRWNQMGLGRPAPLQPDQHRDSAATTSPSWRSACSACSC